MNAFEQIVSDILQRNNYWTRVGYKVRLEKQEKVDIGTPTMPNYEIDVLAYNAKGNEIIWIECKSYLDSTGVKHEDLLPGGKGASHYKVFTNQPLRETVSKALLCQAQEDGITNPNPKLSYWLVAGNIASAMDEKKITELFNVNGWVLQTKEWLIKGLEKISGDSWDDNVAATVAKLFVRKR